MRLEGLRKNSRWPKDGKRFSESPNEQRIFPRRQEVMTSVSGYTPVLTKSQKRNKKRRDKVRLAKQEQAREQQKEQGQSTEPEASSTLPAAQPSQGQAELGTDRIRKPRLEKWYKDYITKNNLFELLREVDVDKLDEECVERQVHESMPSTQIQDGYCTVCHKFLESWVKMSSPTSLETTGDFDLPWHANLTQFEASSRRSCQFCKLWLQAIGPRNLLRLRKIDKRLSFLGKPRFLSIRTSSRYEMVYLYWPGTTITSWHPVALAAIRTEASGLGSTTSHNLI